MSSWRPQAADDGLSTLEALVAVAVLGMALIPILAFQTQISQAYGRYNTLRERSELERNALAALRDLNPMERPDGRMSLGESQTVTWTSHPITIESRNTAYPVGDGDFFVAIYRIDAIMVDSVKEQQFSLSFERLGWRKVIDASGTVLDAVP